MKKEKLKITKDNYEGYTKLYDTYFFDEKDETRISNAALGGVISLVIGVVGLLYSPIPLLFGGTILLSICMTAGSVRDIILEKQDNLKKQYPYLNYKISKQELEEALEEVGIVTKDGHGYANIDMTKFEERLQQYEEVKESYMKEQKTNYYSSLECQSLDSEKRVKVFVKKK